MTYEPNHPLADDNGMVRRPVVDLTDQMVYMQLAQRGYQANVATFEQRQRSLPDRSFRSDAEQSWPSSPFPPSPRVACPRRATSPAAAGSAGAIPAVGSRLRQSLTQRARRSRQGPSSRRRPLPAGRNGRPAGRAGLVIATTEAQLMTRARGQRPEQGRRSVQRHHAHAGLTWPNDMRQPTSARPANVRQAHARQKVGLGATVMTIVVGAIRAHEPEPADEDEPAVHRSRRDRRRRSIVDALAGRGVEYDLTDAGHTVLVPSTTCTTSGSRWPAAACHRRTTAMRCSTSRASRRRSSASASTTSAPSRASSPRRCRRWTAWQSATVHLALPEESVFVDEAGNPTASVLIAARGAHRHRRRPGRRDRASRRVIGEEHAACRRHRHRCHRHRSCRRGGSGLTSGGSAAPRPRPVFEYEQARRRRPRWSPAITGPDKSPSP